MEELTYFDAAYFLAAPISTISNQLFYELVTYKGRLHGILPTHDKTVASILSNKWIDSNNFVRHLLAPLGFTGA